MASERPTQQTDVTIANRDGAGCQTNIVNSQAARQPLTIGNLVAHNARMAASSQGPMPMQRWFASMDDVIVRQRRTWRARDASGQDELATKIEQLLRNASRVAKSKSGEQQ